MEAGVMTEVPRKVWRGRPRLGYGRSERIELRVPVEVFDAICRAAMRENTSLAEYVRRAIKRELLSGRARQTPDRTSS